MIADGVDGKGVTKLTDNETIDDDGPARPADGSMIAFANDRDGEHAFARDL